MGRPATWAAGSPPGWAAQDVPFRASVRPAGDTTVLARLGAELVTGDLADPAGLPVSGLRTVVTTAIAVGRWRPGVKDVSISRVDRDSSAA